MTTTIPGRPRKRHRIMPPPTAAVTIPDDLLVSEILVRLPAESLLRSRSVCRSWRAAVKDPAFIRRHLELSRARSPTMLAISWSRPMDEDDPDDADEEATTAPPARVDSVRAAHCNGLVAVTASTGHTARTTVWNPATMESVAVPAESPNVGPFAMITSAVAAIGFDPRANEYVLSRFFYRVNGMFPDGHGSLVVEYDDVGHEVLRLAAGAGAGWRLTENAPFSIDDSVPPVCVRGAIYWAAMDPSASGEEDDVDDGGGANVLLRFSLRDKTFAVIPLPPRVRSVGRRDRVAELAGELCHAHATGPTAFDVWVATGDDDGEPGRPPAWSLRWHVDFYRPVDFVAPLAVDDGGGVLLMSVDDEDLYRYDKRNRVLEKIADVQQVSRPVRWNGSDGRGEGGEIPSSSCAAAQILVPCVESLVSITSTLQGR